MYNLGFKARVHPLTFCQLCMIDSLDSYLIMRPARCPALGFEPRPLSQVKVAEFPKLVLKHGILLNLPI